MPNNYVFSRQQVRFIVKIAHKKIDHTKHLIFRQTAPDGTLDFLTAQLLGLNWSMDDQFIVKATNTLVELYNKQAQSTAQIDDYVWAAFAKRSFQKGKILDLESKPVQSAHQQFLKQLQEIYKSSELSEQKVQDAFMDFMRNLCHPNVNAQESANLIHEFLRLGALAAAQSQHNGIKADDFGIFFGSCLLDGGEFSGKVIDQKELEIDQTPQMVAEYKFFAQLTALFLKSPVLNHAFSPNLYYIVPADVSITETSEKENKKGFLIKFKGKTKSAPELPGIKENINQESLMPAFQLATIARNANLQGLKDSRDKRLSASSEQGPAKHDALTSPRPRRKT